MTEQAVATPPEVPVDPAQQPQAGPPVEDVYEDYWGTEEVIRWYLPDGKQYFDFKPMNEGQKAKFQKKTSRDLVVDQRTSNARVSIDPATDRHELIKASVVGWFLVHRDALDSSGWVPMPFSARALDDWLDKANAKAVEKLEFQIRLANPWIQGDMTTEQLKEQITQLEELLKQKEREDLGEVPSGDR